VDDFKLLGRSFNDTIAFTELEGQTCGLKHSIEDPARNHKAVDYLCQNLGDQGTEEITSQMRIPVCTECVVALNDPSWVLAYCTYCNKSQCIYRPLAKNEHPEGNGIYWLDVCPFCAEVMNEYKEDK